MKRTDEPFMTADFVEPVKAYRQKINPDTEFARNLLSDDRRIQESKEKLFLNKTVQSIEWENGGNEGYANLRIHFTDGTSVKINYSCVGGVYISQ